MDDIVKTETDWGKVINAPEGDWNEVIAAFETDWGQAGSKWSGRKVQKFIKGLFLKIIEAITVIINNIKNHINLIEIKYDDLVKLRNEGNLIPGALYRIIDYITTVANDPEARSAGHPFDIIVMAIGNDTLSEEAMAIKSSRDGGYFDNCNLEGWKLWYSLDNDTKRFQWADSSNGKGVIFRMIDEWNNDCPYDFKNVQFKRYWSNGKQTKGDIILKGYFATLTNQEEFTEGVDLKDYLWCYTFTRLKGCEEDYDKNQNQNIVFDESIQIDGFDFDLGDDKLGTPGSYKYNSHCSNNSFKTVSIGITIDDNSYLVNALLNNVFLSILLDVDVAIVYKAPFDNTFGANCVNNTFGAATYDNHFQSGCCNNICGNRLFNNIFGNGNSFNTFGNELRYNSFGNECQYNTFGNNGWYNSFGNNCQLNSFGNDCRNNSFGNGCDGNSFGNNCSRNSFGNSFLYNAIGNGVQYISILTESVKYTHVLNGTIGSDSSNLLSINFMANKKSSQYAGLNSSGVLKIWTPADLV